jgi:hypothetical protein
MKYFLVLFISLLFCLVAVQAQSGLYMRTQMWGSSLDISWLFFAPGNKVVRNPKFGVNPIQLQKEVAENSANVASYTLTRTKMNLQWGNGIKQSINVEFSGRDLSAFDGGYAVKLCPLRFLIFLI